MLNAIAYILGIIFGAVIAAVCCGLVLVGIIAVAGSILLMLAVAGGVVFIGMFIVGVAGAVI